MSCPFRRLTSVIMKTAAGLLPKACLASRCPTSAQGQKRQLERCRALRLPVKRTFRVRNGRRFSKPIGFVPRKSILSWPRPAAKDIHERDSKKEGGTAEQGLRCFSLLPALRKNTTAERSCLDAEGQTSSLIPSSSKYPHVLYMGGASLLADPFYLQQQI